MNTMKRVIVVLALMLGQMAIASADSPRRWNVTTTTGTYTQVFTKYGYILAIRNSSGATTSSGEYGTGISTMPNATNGGVNGTFQDIFLATTTIIPPIVYRTTTSAVTGDSLTGNWTAGNDDGAYVDSDFYWIQSSPKSGGAFQSTIIWSK